MPGPEYCDWIETLSFEARANSLVGHVTVCGGRSMMLNETCLESPPPELFAQIVWSDHSCNWVAEPDSTPFTGFSVNPRGSWGCASHEVGVPPPHEGITDPMSSPTDKSNMDCS